MRSVAIRQIEQRWEMPFWQLVASLAAQGLNRADSARALGLPPRNLRYHLEVNPALDPFPPVSHPPKEYARDTGETFRDACIRMSATHTLTQAARETGYADSSCFKRALKARGLCLTFQRHETKRKTTADKRLILEEHALTYAALRLDGVLHEAAAARVGFTGIALREKLKRVNPALWQQVKQIGLQNSRESRTQRQILFGTKLGE